MNLDLILFPNIYNGVEGCQKNLDNIIYLITQGVFI